MEIVFVRHSEKKEGIEDPQITKKGEKQSKRLANKLKKFVFNEFYCSNTKRSKETARIISKKIKMVPKIEDTLNEFTSKTLKKRKSSWDKYEKRRYDKLLEFLKRISKDPTEKKKILIVAHGVTNRLIMAYFLDLKLNNIIRLSQNESAMNVIYWGNKVKNWRLMSWNDLNHLSDKLKIGRNNY